MTKAQIMDAAFRVWGRAFYQKPSLSQLAKELGVSKPALYRHFASKQALLDAMMERFFDDFAASIRRNYDRALQIKDADEELFAILRDIADFYARNVYAFIFALINLYDRNIDSSAATDRLKMRGVDMEALLRVARKKYDAEPAVIRLTFPTLTFLMADFHKNCKSFETPASEAEVRKIISVISTSVASGLGYSQQEIDALQFEALEKRIDETGLHAEPEPLFRAVAEAVAEAGPWETSMDMVAHRMGISKSSLYGHFKNRKDMLRRLFLTEFRRIIGFARQNICLSSVPAEQLYLGIFSLAAYLRLRPEFLATLDWIRTRKLDLGKPEKHGDVFRLFEEVDIEPIRGGGGEEEKRRVSHWILFLLISILMRPGLADNRLENDDIRVLYRFVTLGLGGFKR